MTTATIVLFAALGADGVTTDIPWRSNLEAARREALEKGQPLLVVFR